MITQNIIAIISLPQAGVALPVKVSIKCQTAGHTIKIKLIYGGMEFDCAESARRIWYHTSTCRAVYSYTEL
jgi:hypothetical protein